MLSFSRVEVGATGKSGKDGLCDTRGFIELGGDRGLSRFDSFGGDAPDAAPTPPERRPAASSRAFVMSESAAVAAAALRAPSPRDDDDCSNGSNFFKLTCWYVMSCTRTLRLKSDYSLRAKKR